MDKFQFQTIAASSEAKLTDKNSRFIAYAYPIETEEDAMSILINLHQEHPKATHHCYALRIGLDDDLFRANDDGEPSGSAGKPILGRIDKFKLTNVFICVVRYYGGVNLGVSGLIKAYKAAAQLALENAKIITKEIQQKFIIEVAYADVNHFQDLINKYDVSFVNEEFGETSASYTIKIGKGLFHNIHHELLPFALSFSKEE